MGPLQCSWGLGIASRCATTRFCKQDKPYAIQPSHHVAIFANGAVTFAWSPPIGTRRGKALFTGFFLHTLRAPAEGGGGRLGCLPLCPRRSFGGYKELSNPKRTPLRQAARLPRSKPPRSRLANPLAQNARLRAIREPCCEAAMLRSAPGCAAARL
jgi:hypothetical protein